MMIECAVHAWFEIRNRRMIAMGDMEGAVFVMDLTACNVTACNAELRMFGTPNDDHHHQINSENSNHHNHHVNQHSQFDSTNALIISIPALVPSMDQFNIKFLVVKVQVDAVVNVLNNNLLRRTQWRLHRLQMLKLVVPYLSGDVVEKLIAQYDDCLID
jgi:hypothetical protein